MILLSVFGLHFNFDSYELRVEYSFLCFNEIMYLEKSCFKNTLEADMMDTFREML